MMTSMIFSGLFTIGSNRFRVKLIINLKLQLLILCKFLLHEIQESGSLIPMDCDTSTRPKLGKSNIGFERGRIKKSTPSCVVLEWKAVCMLGLGQIQSRLSVTRQVFGFFAIEEFDFHVHNYRINEWKSAKPSPLSQPCKLGIGSGPLCLVGKHFCSLLCLLLSMLIQLLTLGRAHM